MKALFNFLLLLAVGLMFYDDHATRADLQAAQSRADAAEKQVQDLTADLQELQAKPLRVVSRSQIGAQNYTPASNSSSWFQQRLNGAPTVLDPGGTVQDPKDR